MKIQLSTNPETGVIAHEINLDSFAGEFVVSSDRAVLYRPPDGGDLLFVNSDIQRFVECAHVWNLYTDEVRQSFSEAAQLSVVAATKARICAIEHFDTHPESFWPCLLEQAEHGLM
jgi:hypothetical protein